MACSARKPGLPAGLPGRVWSGPIIPGAEPLVKSNPERSGIVAPPPRTPDEPVPEAALRRRPDHAAALITKADILLAMRRLDDAIAAYEAALATDPSLAPAQLGLAMAQDAAGRNAEAEQSYRRVLQSNPKQVLALNGLAVLLTNRNANLDEAVDLARQAYREALKLDPNHAPARTALGALSTDTPTAR